MNKIPGYEIHYAVPSTFFTGLVPFYLTWDIDGFLGSKMLAELNKKDR